MKVVTNFVQRVGIDRLLHFFVSAMLTALSLPWGYCATTFIAAITGVSMALSAFRKKGQDKEESQASHGQTSTSTTRYTELNRQQNETTKQPPLLPLARSLNPDTR